MPNWDSPRRLYRLVPTFTTCHQQYFKLRKHQSAQFEANKRIRQCSNISLKTFFGFTKIWTNR